jgi:phosphate transport system substrate-binding protein
MVGDEVVLTSVELFTLCLPVISRVDTDAAHSSGEPTRVRINSLKPRMEIGTMMIRKNMAGVAVAVAASFTLVGCAGGSEPVAGAPSSSGEENAAETIPGLSGTLVGAGASSQGSAQEAWVAGFQTANPDVTVTYDPIGSGGGRETFQNGASSFAGSDRAFKVEEIAEDNFGSCEPGTGIFEIPGYISPIAIIFNLDGISSLNLDADTIAGIFTGQITNWSDPAITSQNEGVDLPDLTITAVHRSDESGTTANFTDYVAKAAPDAWLLNGENAGSFEAWPAEWGGEGAPQTSGVVDAVTNGVGTIGYADASRAGSLGTVAVKVGDEYVPYSAEAAAAIVDASPADSPGERNENDLAISLARDTTAAGTYPIVLVSYLIGCNDYVDDSVVPLVQAYIGYVVSEEGQATAAANAGNAPISADTRAKAEAILASIN